VREKDLSLSQLVVLAENIAAYLWRVRLLVNSMNTHRL